jgi:hypothetical protein
MQYRIEQDICPESPREWDNLGTMVCWHRRYNLGDKQPNCTPQEFLQRLEEEEGQGYVILSLYLYDHSGITMNTTGFMCPWDSGIVGYIYCLEEDIEREYGEVTTETVNKVRNVLRQEVKIYDQFISGDVWGYFIEDEDGDVLDSCWGFYGYNDCEAEAESRLNELKEAICDIEL